MNPSDKPVIVEQIFNTTKTIVWNAITQLGQMKQWYFVNIESFEPEVGFETRFVVQVNDRIFPHLWKITEVIPMEKIAYSWRYDGYPGCSIVTFQLIEHDNQTKLRLTHEVIESFPDAIPEFKRESGVKGWNYFIKESLKEYLENE